MVWVCLFGFVIWFCLFGFVYLVVKKITGTGKFNCPATKQSGVGDMAYEIYGVMNQRARWHAFTLGPWFG